MPHEKQNISRQNEIRMICSLHVLTHCSPQSMPCNCVPWPHVSVTRCSIGRSQRSHSSVLLHLLFRCTIHCIPIGSLHFREPETTVYFCLIVYLLGTQSYQHPFKSSWPRSTDPVMGSWLSWFPLSANR